MEDFAKVIKGCINKDHKYQRIIYDQYRSYAFKIVFRYIYTQEQAVSAVNDGFVKMFNNIENFKSIDEIDEERLFMGWLKKIMINTSIDRLRKEKLSIETGSISETAWEFPDNNCNADDVLFYNDLITLVKELPPAYRMVFNLHVIDGYSHVEIADIINIPVNTSRSNLLRARTLLQKGIKKMEDDLVCRM